jgi:hypothetical protein
MRVLSKKKYIGQGHFTIHLSSTLLQLGMPFLMHVSSSDFTYTYFRGVQNNVLLDLVYFKTPKD